jgi:hypothetical protein
VITIQLRDEALKAAEARAGNLSRILSAYIGESFAGGDAALRQFVVHNRRVGGPSAPDFECRDRRRSGQVHPPRHDDGSGRGIDSRRLRSPSADRVESAVECREVHAPGGRVSVHVAPESDQVAIVIEDTGVGISREFLPHVLERFRQQDGGTTRRFGGLGLGLAIARNLVERHGGSITADSDGEGHGARVTVRLPVSSSADEPTTAGLQQAVMD